MIFFFFLTEDDISESNFATHHGLAKISIMPCIVEETSVATEMNTPTTSIYDFLNYASITIV